MQIVPFGLNANDKIDVMYSTMAKFAGLEYTRWAPSDNRQVEIDWDQLLDDENVKQKVCEYGVDNLYERGTSSFVKGADTTWLAVFFYINQNIRVDTKDFQQWLGSASEFPNFQSQQLVAYKRMSMVETSADTE